MLNQLFVRCANLFAPLFDFSFILPHRMRFYVNTADKSIGKFCESRAAFLFFVKALFCVCLLHV